MLSEFKSDHWNDDQGKPSGGQSYGDGFAIAWQRGPLGRGDDRKAPNGAFVETVIAAVIDRIEFYQSGEFACDENAHALEHLHNALSDLDARTRNREARQVEGTHSP